MEAETATNSKQVDSRPWPAEEITTENAFDHYHVRKRVTTLLRKYT